MTCPNCHGNNVELISHVEIEVDYCRMEEYLCHDCDCECTSHYIGEKEFFDEHFMKIGKHKSKSGCCGNPKIMCGNCGTVFSEKKKEEQ